MKRAIRKIAGKTLFTILPFVLFTALWKAVTAISGVSEALLPPPENVAVSLWSMLAGGEVWDDIASSLSIFAAGWVIAVVSGTVLGVFLGWYRKIFDFLNPVIQVLRPVSPVAWLPFIVLWFGIGAAPTLVTVIIAGFFPVLLTAVAAVRHIDPVYFRVADSFGLGNRRTMLEIVFPAVLTELTSAFHTALGTGWIFLTAGEMAGSQQGLGYLIIDARNNFDTAGLVSAVILVGVTGLILDTLLGALERYVLKRTGITA